MNDDTIIRLFWDRSPEAIPEVQEKYGGLCRQLAGRILGIKEDVEECMDDVYMALWDTIPPARPVHLQAYIARITRNLAMHKLSYLSAKQRSDSVTVAIEELDGTLAGGADPQDLLRGKELERAITAFLSGLDSLSRQIFLRRYYFFDSVKEIARFCGVSQSNVKVRLHRTRKQLKEYLIKEEWIYERT